MIAYARGPAVNRIDIDDELIEVIYDFILTSVLGTAKLESFALCGLSIKVRQIRNRTRAPCKTPQRQEPNVTCAANE
jgi:hypothetical protein